MARDRQNAAWQYHLRVLRWRKLLENARRLMRSFDDAAEKLAGDYIFDQHYVLSCPERILEGLGDMLQDVRVLQPANLESLEGHLAQARIDAESLTRNGAPPAGAAGSETAEEFPEYGLLARIIDHWIEGAPPGGLSARALFWQVMDRAAGAILAGDAPRGPARPLGPGLLFCDLDGSGKPEGQAPESAGRAWACLASGMAHAQDTTVAGARGPWTLGVSGDRFTLHRPDAAGGLLLDASMQGHQPSDYFFLYSREPIAPDDGSRTDLRRQRTAAGHAVWLMDASADALSEALGWLGQALLSSR